jgi:patatin-like phospholipase/acyl hydrolase
LFDLIVGSGMGGIVALIVSIKSHYSPEKMFEFFFDYPNKIFKANLITKLHFWIKNKYGSKQLIATTKELFGEDFCFNTSSSDQTTFVHFFFFFFFIS